MYAHNFDFEKYFYLFLDLKKVTRMKFWKPIKVCSWGT